jgi:hypothetical protein
LIAELTSEFRRVEIQLLLGANQNNTGEAEAEYVSKKSENGFQGGGKTHLVRVFRVRARFAPTNIRILPIS